MVGYWTFDTKDRSNATNATDKSGLQNHGTVTGATFTNEGRFKEGYKFDGVNDKITRDETGHFNSTEAFSLTAWMRHNGPVSTVKGVIAKDQDGAAREWSLVTEGSSNTITFRIFNSTGGYPSGSGCNKAFTINEWEFIGLVWNGTHTKGYINEESCTSTGLPAEQGRKRGTASITIGSHFLTSRFWNGSIDEVRIYAQKNTSIFLASTKQSFL